MSHHHPDDTLLLGLAAGMLDSGTAIVVAAHVERCVHCQTRVRDFESVGGAMLEELEPAVLAPEALASTLARIEDPVRPRSAPESPPGRLAGPGAVRAHLPHGLPWPRSMHGCPITHWRWLGPGMRWSRVTVPYDRAANVFLLRIAAGKGLPQHTHSERELTQVLYGAFDDGRSMFGPGDFDEADDSIRHRPVVQPDGECICLASVKGKVLFEGVLARMLGSLVGI